VVASRHAFAAVIGRAETGRTRKIARDRAPLPWRIKAHQGSVSDCEKTKRRRSAGEAHIQRAPIAADVQCGTGNFKNPLSMEMCWMHGAKIPEKLTPRICIIVR